MDASAEELESYIQLPDDSVYAEFMDWCKMVRGSRVPATHDSMIADSIDNLAHCSFQTHREFISNSRKLESIWKHSISHSRTNRPFDVSRRLKQTFASSNNSSLSWYGYQQLLHTTMHWEARLCRTISPQRVLCCHVLGICVASLALL